VRLFSENTKVQALRRAPLFEGLDKKTLELLAQVAEDVEVAAGKTLCREGDVAREFFVIVDGEVEVTRGGERLTTLGAGDFFGEIALVEHAQRTATVTATTPLRFFVLTSQGFWGIVETSLEVQAQVMRTLAKRLHRAEPDPSL
jgi:CRP-like cAMP-binding protein